MTDTSNAVRTAAISTGLSALAGLVGGPLLSTAVGFVTGLPVQLITAVSLAAMIWLDPMTGIWLTIATVAAVVGFIFGAIRKPPISLAHMTSRQDGTQRIAHLEKRLAEASNRERALVAALLHTHAHSSPAVLPAPPVAGQVSD
jgi:hypothetical protein